jgi:hypothetical protein
VVADAVLGIRRSRAVRILRATDALGEGGELTVVVAARSGRRYEPAGDAEFSAALATLTRR